jgi:cold shock CspA family protein
MADSYNKKEREKKRKKRKKDKAEAKAARKDQGKSKIEFMYVDADGNLTSTPPDPAQKEEFSLEEIMISVPKKTEEDESKFIRKGVVKFFNNDKGFGFIRDKANDDSVFVHIDNLEEPIKEGDKVTFEMGSGPKGPVALNVKKVKL